MLVWIGWLTISTSVSALVAHSWILVVIAVSEGSVASLSMMILRYLLLSYLFLAILEVFLHHLIVFVMLPFYICVSLAYILGRGALITIDTR